MTTRALFLTTHTPNCEVFWLSLQSIGVDVLAYPYNDRPLERQHELVSLADTVNPDVIIYVAALEGPPWYAVLGPDILCQLRAIAPTVMICCDVSDKAMWAKLDEYAARECFDISVSIDGTDREGFLTKLTPVDPRVFLPKLWQDRTVLVGYSGGDCGGERFDVINAIGAKVCGPALLSDMARFLCDCKVIINAPVNGSGNGDHVKGRVIETAFAGACLLERRSAVVERWFRPGWEYVEYENPADAVEKMKWIQENDYETSEIARRLFLKVNSEHSPIVFWSDVLVRVGVHL